MIRTVLLIFGWLLIALGILVFFVHSVGSSSIEDETMRRFVFYRGLQGMLIWSALGAIMLGLRHLIKKKASD